MTEPQSAAEIATTSLPERILAKIDFGGIGGCWTWTACRTPKGYGMVKWDRVNRPAHRVVYAHLVGPIPPGMQIDHLCRVRACVNPAHLEPVTPRENIARGVSTAAHSVRTGFCRNGHDLNDPANIVAGEVARGQRACRPCQQSRANAQQAAIRAAHRLLGMTRRDYIAEHGASQSVAEAVLARRAA